MKLNRLYKSVLGMVLCGLTLGWFAPATSFAASKPDGSTTIVNSKQSQSQAVVPQPKQSQTPVISQPKVCPKPGTQNCKTNVTTNCATTNCKNHVTNCVTTNCRNHATNCTTNCATYCSPSYSSYNPYCLTNYCWPSNCGNYVPCYNR